MGSKMLDANQTTVILGDEFDDALRTKLMGLLRELGAIAAGAAERSVAGSQDLEKFDVVVGGQVLHVEAETYIGLSIRGPTKLVKAIQDKMTE